eukprot:TRINITY_DN6606_c0_g1_i1.p1 TRINITY_DN6606_c0_g1~~TRINITY_DN6606_c0_g1_i1.p1  ORF type:complete len:832 (+),score=195.24 TRINITY_DN6606_c0_g1_i1:40-2496(+)
MSADVEAAAGTGKQLVCKYQHDAQDDTELSIEPGDVVDVLEETSDDWWLVSHAGRRGLVPVHCCRPVGSEEDEDDGKSAASPDSPEVEMTDIAAQILRNSHKARETMFAVCTHPFEAIEEGELSLTAGDAITLLDLDQPNGWWLGQVGDKKGIFPAEFVAPQPQDGHTSPLPLPSPSPDLTPSLTCDKKRRLPSSLSLPMPVNRVVKYLKLQRLRVFVFLVLLGFVCGCVSYAMDLYIKLMYSFRRAGVLRINYYGAKYIYWAATMVFSVFCSFVLAKLVNPPFTLGSGVPEMKTLMSGIEMPGYLAFKTLVGKVLSLSCAIGSGMFVGKQGPMVHIGAMISHALLQVPGFHDMTRSRPLRSQLLATGMVAGISSHFGTPIGGLMFSIEVATSFVATNTYWFGCVAAVVGAITTRLYYNLFEDNYNLWGPFFHSSSPVPEKRIHYVYSMLICVCIGVSSAPLAVLFIKAHWVLAKLRKRFPRFPLFYWPSLYLLAVAIGTAVVTFPELFGDYMSLTPYQTIKDLISQDLTSSTCAAKDWDRWNVIGSILILMFCRFVLTVLTVSAPIPCGLYVTNLVIGMLWGRLIGEFLKYSDTDFPTGVFAMAGGAAYVGCLTHTISSAVIVMELTGQTSNLMEVLAATVAGLFVMGLLSRSIFDVMIGLRGLPYLPDVELDENARVADVMAPGPLFVTRLPTIEELSQLCAKIGEKAGQPVIAVVSDADQKLFLGALTKDQLKVQCEAARAQEEGKGAKSQKHRVALAYNAHHSVMDTSMLTHLHFDMVNMRLQQVFVTRKGRLVGWASRTMIKAHVQKLHKILL